MPYFKSLADKYAMSDNFHQSVNGGTGANHIMLGHGDAIWFSDGDGQATTPPHNVEVARAPPTPASSTRSRIRIRARHQQLVHGGRLRRRLVRLGLLRRRFLQQLLGSDAARRSRDRQVSADPAAPDRSALRGGALLSAQQLQPRLFRQRQQRLHRHNANNTVFTIPPSSTRSIGDSLLASNISWKYYGDQWNNYVPDPYQLNYGAIGAKSDEYCNICNPFQYDTSIMTNASRPQRAHPGHRQSVCRHRQRHAARRFIRQAQRLVDGHPASSKLDLFEGFAKKIVDAVKANPELWKDTAISSPSMRAAATTTPATCSRWTSSATARASRCRGVALHPGRAHLARLLGSRLDPQVHRAQLGPEAGHLPQPRQLPNPIVERAAIPTCRSTRPAIGDLFDLFDFGGHQSHWWN